MRPLIDHDAEGDLVAAALEGFKTVPLAAVRMRATVRVLAQVEATATPLVAPVSGATCALYDIAFLHAAFRGVALYRALSTAPFTIVDASGDRAVVDPAYAQLRVKRRGASIRREDELGAELQTLSARAGTWVRAKVIVIAPGDHVVVVGAAMEELDRDDDRRIGSYRGLAPTRLRLGGTEQYPIMISTHPRDLDASRAHLESRW